SFFQGGAVHPGHHEDPSGLLILDDRGDQSIGIELQLVVKTHTHTGNHCTQSKARWEAESSEGASYGLAPEMEKVENVAAKPEKFGAIALSGTFQSNGNGAV